MKGYTAGVYECKTCEELHHVSDAASFGDGFMPAAYLNELDPDHTLYWKGEA